MNINLNSYTSKESFVISGRDKGVRARGEKKLNVIDANNEVINIEIPEDIISLNPSFFLGMFGPSIRSLGIEKFRSKYLFKCSESIKKTIDAETERAIKKSSVLED